MSTTSPLPGIIQAGPRLSGRGAPLRRWLGRSVPTEPADTPGRIAIAASALAAAFALGDLVLETGFPGLFPYRFARLIVYGASLLSGLIIAAGFLSNSRTARFTALLATTTVAGYALAAQLHLPGGVFQVIRIGYGVGLLSAAVVAGVRALRRRVAPASE